MHRFARIHCHYCGTRSSHGKNAGTKAFQCTHCEALNYFDENGNIADPPIEKTSPTATQQENWPALKSMALAPIVEPQHQVNQPFCNTCIQNQNIMMETLANYLPDESDPRYKEFEAALPTFRADLEKRYPQVCRDCATNVQRKMNRADYFGLTENVAARSRNFASRQWNSLGRTGPRDNMLRWSTRMALALVGLASWMSMMVQISWHGYGIATTVMNGKPGEWGSTDFDSMPSLRGCAKQTVNLHFDSACFERFGSLMPRALLTTLCLLWYNPGLTDLFHHTKRIERVDGQGLHFKLQAIILFCRATAYSYLSAPAFTAHLGTSEVLAAHGFLILLTLLGDRLSKRAIEPIPWKLKGNKTTPKPEEQDIFAEYAGPAKDRGPPELLSLTGQRVFKSRMNAPSAVSTTHGSGSFTPPSPPISDTSVDDGEPMEVDYPSPPIRMQMSGAPNDKTYRPKVVEANPRRQLMRSDYNHGTQSPAGWGGMRNELISVQQSLRADEERKTRDSDTVRLKYEPQARPSPFYGRLPQAPMSMERRLRNPPTQVSFKKAPLSRQENFMAQMREGIDDAKSFSARMKSPKSVHFNEKVDSYSYDQNVTPSPAIFRTRGQLDLKDSGWRLPSDLNQSTGLEDLFTSSFTLSDEPILVRTGESAQPRHTSGVSTYSVALGFCCVIAAVFAVWQVPEIRRPTALWMVRQLEAYGL